MTTSNDLTLANSGKASLPYIERSRQYYEAQGFTAHYQYAQFDEKPFAPLPKPLSNCTVGLVTTSSTYPREPLEPRRVDSGSTLFAPKTLFTADLSWDKDATHTDDIETYCPIESLQRLADQGMIGALSRRFHCAPTEYSHRATLQQDAPELLRRLREDEADVALLVPL
ncbi:MAG: hypothetical protein HN856_14250 [Gammaproteobacteria bacterium]|jgi:hypothetical protein|nr:hypothetical protein [Gammaproteobacteria bacterium]MCH1550392.1 hypothetical protein [Pseudomonadales bacterium]